MAEEKKKQYVSNNAQLMAEWDSDKNNEAGLDPHKLTCGSGIKAWWKCDSNHSWQAQISSRSRGAGCPYCSGRFAVSGVNDLQTLFPKVADEWDYKKNSDLPSQISSYSQKKAWWICPIGHSYQCTVNHRSQGDGCPYCSNHKVLVGYNDLATKNSELVKEWDYAKNHPLLPSMVTPNSGKKVWWMCSKGHGWEAIIYSRSNGNGCPICANKRVLPGYNDLATLNPQLASEWNHKKNNDLLPSMFTPNSGTKVWWICSRGHEWKASIDHRTNGRGCPVCLTDRRSSFPEQAIFYYLSKEFPQTQNRYKLNQKYELDIYLPELNIAVEYDGVFFHASDKAIRNEKSKNAACYNEKILLIRIKEDRNTKATYVEHWNQYLTKIVFNPDNDYKYLQSALVELISILNEIQGVMLDINLERDRTKILELLKQSDVKNNLEERCPEIAAEWNYQRNGSLLPSSFAWASNQSVWWKCSNGHEYQAIIANRTVLARNCPVCAIKRRAESKHITNVTKRNFYVYCRENGKDYLLNEWDFDANDGKTPEDYSTGNGNPVWWICKTCSYKWQASIPNRIKGTGCPQCYILRRKKQKNSTPVNSENALTTWCHKNNRASILAEWNHQKNKYPPENYSYGSHAIVWWKCCTCNHEWEAEIKSRALGRGCPECAKQKRKKNKE